MSEARLAGALSAAVNARFDRGRGYVRLPELARPMPIAALLSLLLERPSVRVGLLVDEPDGVADPERVTQDVHVAIDWRNEGGVDDLLVVVGDLDRDRASGLSDVGGVSAAEVRRRLFEEVVVGVSRTTAPAQINSLLQELAELEALTDLWACADYCEHLDPLDDRDLADRVRSELWRLGLLPDGTEGPISARRLQRNLQVVSDIYEMNATTLQRLIRSFADSDPGMYRALREFALTRDRTHLAPLNFEVIRDGVRATGLPPGPDLPDAPDPVLWFVTAIRGATYEESHLLDQVLPDESGAFQQVTFDGQDVAWNFVGLSETGDFWSAGADAPPYEEQSGSTEIIGGATQALAGAHESITWHSVIAIREQLAVLEEHAGVPARAADLIDAIVTLRARLWPYRHSIPADGVRLFMGAPELRDNATQLLNSWVQLWEAMGAIRDGLPAARRGFLRTVAQTLSISDSRLRVEGADVRVYLSPLHPTLLEPRLRAGELFSNQAEFDRDLFDLVADSLDPATPSLTVPVHETPVPVTFNAQIDGSLVFGRSSEPTDAADMARSAKEILERFLTIHPYARLSLSVALVDPGPGTLRRLARSAVDLAEHIRLDIFALRRNAAEMRRTVELTKDDLLSGDVPPGAVVLRVIEVSDLRATLERLEQPGGQVHVALLFDVAETYRSSASESQLPALGSLISEWEFDTDPIADRRPLIRPRSGSTLLLDLLEAQSTALDWPWLSQERSPLLAPEVEDVLGELASRTNWTVLCEAASVLVPPARLGERSEFVGQLGGSSHSAFVYALDPLVLLDPVLAYLQRNTWLHPDETQLTDLLLGVVRRAIPEGLLGFYKTRGQLSDEAVLGRLGVSVVLAYLRAQEGPEPLCVSLDTRVARHWLGLREDTSRRADLVQIEFGVQAVVTAIEVKARTEPLAWGTAPPPLVSDALLQVNEIFTVLSQVLGTRTDDSVTGSRREVLKRQIFLEALEQWEPLRVSDPDAYAASVDRLNEIFDPETEVVLRKEIFVVTSRGTSQEPRALDGAQVRFLGIDWLRGVLAAESGGSVEISADLLDDVVEHFDSVDADSVSSSAMTTGTEEEPAASIHHPKSENPPTASEQASTHQTGAAVSGGAPGDTSSSGTDNTRAGELTAIGKALTNALIARKAPVQSINLDQAIVGPSVLQIPLRITTGSRLARLQREESDLARELGVESLRILNWPGHAGFALAEIARSQREIPDVTSLERPEDPYPGFAVGASVTGAPVWTSLDTLPHLLVGGKAGSGRACSCAASSGNSRVSTAPTNLTWC